MAGLCVRRDWQSAGRLTEDLVVFVHVLAENGQLVAQNDQQPVAGLSPTSQWVEETMPKVPCNVGRVVKVMGQSYPFEPVVTKRTPDQSQLPPISPPTRHNLPARRSGAWTRWDGWTARSADPGRTGPALLGSGVS